MSVEVDQRRIMNDGTWVRVTGVGPEKQGQQYRVDLIIISGPQAGYTLARSYGTVAGYPEVTAQATEPFGPEGLQYQMQKTMDYALQDYEDQLRQYAETYGGFTVNEDLEAVFLDGTKLVLPCTGPEIVKPARQRKREEQDAART